MIITIDGPSASGKTTAGRRLAKRLGYYYVYSGLMYRALAYLLVQNCMYKEDDLRNPKAEDVSAYLDPERFIYSYEDDFIERVFFDTQDITPHLKTEFIDRAASILSADNHVRDAITKLQRKVARNFNIVADGRDTGSVVFPDADFKFFLTASLEVRAQRWQAQQVRQGNECTVEQAMTILAQRDTRDKQREVAPLIIPEDAIVVNNSDLTADQTLDKMLTYIQRNREIEEG